MAILIPILSKALSALLSLRAYYLFKLLAKHPILKQFLILAGAGALIRVARPFFSIVRLPFVQLFIFLSVFALNSRVQNLVANYIDPVLQKHLGDNFFQKIEQSRFFNFSALDVLHGFVFSIFAVLVYDLTVVVIMALTGSFDINSFSSILNFMSSVQKFTDITLTNIEKDILAQMYAVLLVINQHAGQIFGLDVHDVSISIVKSVSDFYYMDFFQQAFGVNDIYSLRYEDLVSNSFFSKKQVVKAPFSAILNVLASPIEWSNIWNTYIVKSNPSISIFYKYSSQVGLLAVAASILFFGAYFIHSFWPRDYIDKDKLAYLPQAISDADKFLSDKVDDAANLLDKTTKIIAAKSLATANFFNDKLIKNEAFSMTNNPTVRLETFVKTATDSVDATSATIKGEILTFSKAAGEESKFLTKRVDEFHGKVNLDACNLYEKMKAEAYLYSYKHKSAGPSLIDYTCPYIDNVKQGTSTVISVPKRSVIETVFKHHETINTNHINDSAFTMNLTAKFRNHLQQALEGVKTSLSADKIKLQEKFNISLTKPWENPGTKFKLHQYWRLDPDIYNSPDQFEDFFSALLMYRKGLATEALTKEYVFSISVKLLYNPEVLYGDSNGPALGKDGISSVYDLIEDKSTISPDHFWHSSNVDQHVKLLKQISADEKSRALLESMVYLRKELKNIFFENEYFGALTEDTVSAKNKMIDSQLAKASNIFEDVANRNAKVNGGPIIINNNMVFNNSSGVTINTTGSTSTTQSAIDIDNTKILEDNSGINLTSTTTDQKHISSNAPPQSVGTPRSILDTFKNIVLMGAVGYSVHSSGMLKLMAENMTLDNAATAGKMVYKVVKPIVFGSSFIDFESSSEMLKTYGDYVAEKKTGSLTSRETFTNNLTTKAEFLIESSTPADLKDQIREYYKLFHDKYVINSKK